MTKKPKPCPWCGRRPRVVEAGGAWVVCVSESCVVSPESDMQATRAEAIAAWNKRKEVQP